jgi:beta-galactosidase
MAPSDGRVAHHSRVPKEEWEEQILKMKAGGVQIIATYVMWIHHEEVERQFDWSNRRDLHAFVQLCAQHGMFVYPRSARGHRERCETEAF